MSESAPPPPAYDEIEKTSSTHRSNPNWQAWYRKFFALEFNQDEAMEYAKLFVNNDIEINMISELNDGVLKGIGIEKAGHRIRILRLQNKPSIQIPSQRAVATPQPQPQLAVNTPRCAWHPHMAASEKCRKCNRLLCLHCRREKVSDHCMRYYCQNCYEECIIL